MLFVELNMFWETGDCSVNFQKLLVVYSKKVILRFEHDPHFVNLDFDRGLARLARFLK